MIIYKLHEEHLKIEIPSHAFDTRHPIIEEVQDICDFFSGKKPT